MSKLMKCGCRVTPGGPIGYGELREHITKHIPESFSDTASAVFMLELLRGLNSSTREIAKEDFYLETYVPFRFRLFELMTEYDEKIKPGLEKIWPENPLAEALL
ncbi:hypothetical protein LCGC14_2840070 [marine sediment metagenome]|uniref:Uncharacterized protein n=1 Tax=marine sediment metagenome TaxID=412755 RepID=A0A0F8YY37_9ZZZZ